VPDSFLEERASPPKATPEVQESNKPREHERQCDEEQNKQEIQNVLREFYQRRPSPAESEK
jgi:hypothetical protein